MRLLVLTLLVSASLNTMAWAVPLDIVLSPARDNTLFEDVVNASDLSERVMSPHRLVSDWGEGMGGQGALAEPGGATWLHTFYPSSFWSVPGSDFVPTASAATTVGTVGDYAWSSEPLADDVRGWISQSVS